MSGINTVRLRPVGRGDAAAHARFYPSAEITRMYGSTPGAAPLPSLARSEARLSWLTEHPFARVIERGGKMVGHVRLHTLDRQDRRARLAIGLFAQASLGQGIGRQAILHTLDHVFGEMGLLSGRFARSVLQHPCDPLLPLLRVRARRHRTRVRMGRWVVAR